MLEYNGVLKKAEELEKAGKFNQAITLLNVFKKNEANLPKDTLHEVESLLFRIENHKKRKEAEDFRCKIQQTINPKVACEEPNTEIVSEIKFQSLSVDQDLDKMKEILHKSKLSVPKFMKAEKKQREKELRNDLERRLLFVKKLISRNQNNKALAVLNYISDVAEAENYADIAEKAWKIHLKITTHA